MINMIYGKKFKYIFIILLIILVNFKVDAKTLKAYPASFLFCFIRYYYIKLYVSVELLI